MTDLGRQSGRELKGTVCHREGEEGGKREMKRIE